MGRLPARGGGPCAHPREVTQPLSSPRSRGWSGRRPAGLPPRDVVSPLAGVVRPRCRRGSEWVCRLPARGGGPVRDKQIGVDVSSSPRSRGWSPSRRHPPHPSHVVSPLAGVVPNPRYEKHRRDGRLPARGGGPRAPPGMYTPTRSSPRSRGWSCPTLTRGSTSSVVSPLAGVVPRPGCPGGVRPGRLPARGGGPFSAVSSKVGGASSPRSRGWSLDLRRRLSRPRVVSPLAGVVQPGPADGRSARGRLPARGGGPRDPDCRAPALTSSPRSRGWSRGLGDESGLAGVVSPLAGVVHVHGTSAAHYGGRLPARGGGPCGAAGRHRHPASFPRSRGWSVWTYPSTGRFFVVSPLAGVVRR